MPMVDKWMLTDWLTWSHAELQPEIICVLQGGGGTQHSVLHHVPSKRPLVNVPSGLKFHRGHGRALFEVLPWCPQIMINFMVFLTMCWPSCLREHLLLALKVSALSETKFEACRHQKTLLNLSPKDPHFFCDSCHPKFQNLWHPYITYPGECKT